LEAVAVESRHLMLQPGSRFGVFEIQSRVGSGGMGEVFRARDTRLGRDVALKVLHAPVGSNAEHLDRFTREARALASLNHSSIGAIYDTVETDGVRALVLEFVEGETLEERLRGGALPVREAAAIARTIAEALDAAHERGLVHRDLKPANVKITPTGDVKLLDFGIARMLVDLDGHDAATAAGTERGVVIGTAAYMSPEQARGHVVDRRTDVWSFGCVVFEMLSGERAFSGATVSDTLASVLTRDPNWEGLPSSLSPTIVRLLHRCLEKDLKRRLRDLGDARLEIEDAIRSPRTAETVAMRPARVTRRTAIGAVAGAAVGAAAMAAVATRLTRGSSAADVMRFTIALPAGTLANSSFLSRLAISPDGTHIACNTFATTQANL
jgi:serine/threonine protein kinase